MAELREISEDPAYFVQATKIISAKQLNELQQLYSSELWERLIARQLARKKL